jgi:hypothetical protein
MRLVNVRLWDLTDQELADLATQCAATEPDHAAALRHLLAWRQEHPDAPLTAAAGDLESQFPPDQTRRGYLVLRGRFQA